MVEFEWVGWERWNEYMISTGSKAHAEQPDNPNRALCGVNIPESGNGYEVGAASDYADGTCKRCQKAVHTAEASGAWLCGCGNGGLAGAVPEFCGLCGFRLWDLTADEEEAEKP